MASSSSSPLAAAPAAPTTLLDLPFFLLERHIVTHPALDAASRLALFRTSHALARMVLLHAPVSKRLTVEGKSNTRRWWKSRSSSTPAWSATLLHLLGTRWAPLPLADLELKITSSLPPSPPAAISQRVSHLHLHQCAFTGQDLAAWRLHDTALWPHLQHLNVHNCPCKAPATITPQLQPIPRLRFFTWIVDAWLIDDYAPQHHINLLSLLAANATHARLEVRLISGMMLQHLQRLTHCHMQWVMNNQEVQALLQHPTLEHVTVEQWRWDFGLQPSKQPCRWRTLSVLGLMNVRFLGILPLANLDRLTISQGLSAYPSRAVETIAAGVASLQQLHRSGRLVVLPEPANDPGAREGQLQRGSGLFSLWSDVPSNVVALLRLVLEAGQGIETLDLADSALTSTILREEVAPLLQQSGRIHTLCLGLYVSDDDRWGSLLGALTPCITHIKVFVRGPAVLHLKALVLGAVASLAHPLKLTLLHQGHISPTLQAELLQLIADGGGAGSGGGAARVPLLSLEVVRT